MKLWKLAAVAATCLTASPAAAQDGAVIGNWTISANQKNQTCMAYAESDGLFFGIQHSADPDERFVLVNNPAWTKIENGTDYTGSMTAGQRFDTGFMGISEDDITPTLGAALPEGFDKALGKAKSIRIQVRDLNIDVSVAVTDGGKVWKALDNCVQAQ